jgi:hypothetical protein
MDYIITFWLIGSLVGLYLASNKPHLISGLFRRKIKPGIQTIVFLGMLSVCIAVMWALYYVPDPAPYKVKPVPDMYIEEVG